MAELLQPTSTQIRDIIGLPESLLKLGSVHSIIETSSVLDLGPTADVMLSLDDTLDKIFVRKELDILGNFVQYTERATPANPPANEARFYAKDVGGITKPMWLDSAGTETDLTAGGGGGEANTISSQGGGTVLTAAVPKSGVDLRTVSIATTAPITHSVTTDLLTFDINDLVNADISASAAIVTTKLADSANFVLTNRANTFGAFAQRFPTTQLQLDNPAGTFQYIFATSAIITADKTVTLPLLTANDIFVFEAFAQTLTNKILTTPTIGDFSNATHSHLNAAGGGTITEASISDLQSYLLNVVEDTTPQLGGNLDGQGNDITAVEKVVITSTLPQFILEETDQAADTKKWAAEVTGSSFSIAAIDDAETTNISAIKIKRDTGSNEIDNIKLKTGPGTSRLTITDTVLTVGAGVDIDLVNNNLLRAGLIELNNPANTFQYIFTGAAIIADTVVNLPLLTATDTIAMNAFAATLTNKTMTATANTFSGFAIGAEVTGASTALTDTADIAYLNQANTFGAFLNSFVSSTMRIPLSATPTMAVDGDFAIDTTITDFSMGLIKYFDGEEMVVVSIPVAETVTPTGGHVITYNATNDEFELVAQTGGSQTPWSSDIDADGFDLTDLSNILFRTTTGAPIATDRSIHYEDTEGMVFNALTGDFYQFEINAVNEMRLTATELNLQNNKLANVNPTTITEFTTVTAVSGDFIWIIDATDGLSKKVNANDFLGAASQTPWTSDIDADGFDLTDLSNILFRNSTGVPTATDRSIHYNDVEGMVFNALTGDFFQFEVNAVQEYRFTATQADFNSNNVVNMGTLNTHTVPGGTSTFALFSDNLSVFAATTSAQLAGVISDETGSGLLVFGTSPTIVTPTIASFVNATHGHTAASSGGTLLSTAALSDTADIAYLNQANTFGAFLTTFAGSTLRIPVSATPTITVNGDIAIDTTITDFTTPLIRYFGTESMVVVSVPDAQIVTPTGGHVISYNATNDEFELVAQTGGSQTPWVSDIDADGFDLVDLSNIEFRQTTAEPIGAALALYANAGGIIINVPTGNRLEVSVNNVDILQADITNGVSVVAARFEMSKGADVTSTGDITLTNDGNTFDITGSTTINTIAALNWRAGSVIHLQFDAAPLITHNSGGVNDILLANATNFQTAAGNVLSLFFNGTDWVEVSRSPITTAAQTPWASDIDAANFDINNLGSIEFSSAPTLLGSQASINWDTSSLTVNVPTGDFIDFGVNGSLQFRIFAGTVALRGNRLEFDLSGGSFIEGDGGGLEYDVATGDTHDFFIDGVSEYVFNATQLDMLNNNLIIGTGIIQFSDANTTIQDVAAGDIQMDVANAQQFTWRVNNVVVMRNTGFQLDIGTMFLELDEITAPAQPAANSGRLYAKDVSTVSHVFWKADDDTEFDLTLGAGSQTPWTSDIDADGFDLNDLSNILFRNSAGVPTATDRSIHYNDAEGMVFNALTGDVYRFEINGVLEATLSATSLDLQGNNIILGANPSVLQFSTVNHTIGMDVSNNLNYNVPATDGHVWNIDGAAELVLSNVTLDLQSNTITDVGSITMNAGSILTLNSSTLSFINANQTIVDNAGSLEYDVATGNIHRFRVNNATEMELSATVLDIQNNNLIIGTGLIQLTDANTTIQTNAGSLEIDVATGETIAHRINNVTELSISPTAINAPNAIFQENGIPISPIGVHDIWIPGGSMTSTTTNGAESTTRELAENQPTLQLMAFDTATEEHAQFFWTPPRNWDRGTITYEVYWTASAGSGTFTCDLGARAYGNDDPLGVNIIGAEISVTDTLLAINDEHISPTSAALTVQGTLADAKKVIFQLSRPTTDSIANDVEVLGIFIHFTTDAAVAA